MRMRVRSLASLFGLRIQCCYELWCTSQTWLGSHVTVAVVQAGSCGSNLTPSLGTYTCHGCDPKKKKKKKNRKNKSFDNDYFQSFILAFFKLCLEYTHMRCSKEGDLWSKTSGKHCLLYFLYLGMQRLQFLKSSSLKKTSTQLFLFQPVFPHTYFVLEAFNV